MDKLTAKVKEAYEQTLPSEAQFTEAEKQKVRDSIAKLQSKRPKRKLELLPKTLTVLVASGFLLFVGGLIGNQIDFSGQQKNGAIEKSTKQQADSTNVFYSTLKVGDQLNGWKLVSKDPHDGNKIKPSGLKQVKFIGSAVITGYLRYSDENSQLYPNKLLFIPDDKSLSALPIAHEVFKKVLLDFDDQPTVEKILDIKPGEEKHQITIEIDQYTANDKASDDIPDTVHFAYVIQNDGKEVRQNNKLKVDNLNRLQLPNRLQNFYTAFSKTHKEMVLKGLSPLDIFQLYFYAEEQEDFKTQYALYIDDPQYEPTFRTYQEFAAASKQSKNGNQSILNIIKSAQFEEKSDGNNGAHIIISKDSGLGFGLTKNKNGIWKVNWNPLQ